MEANGKRKYIRLGEVTQRQAQSVRLFVENLVSCKSSGDPPKTATTEWLVGLSPVMRKRVERAGLVGPSARQECPTLAAWMQTYIDGRTDLKASTKRNLEIARDDLRKFFGERALDSITVGDADGFRIHLKAKGLAEATIRRKCKRAKQFFGAAVRKEIIAKSPFADMRCGNQVNPTRFYFVSREEAQAVLDACPDVEWRLIFALCRYGGLRCPTEILRLTWGDVDWERGRFTVHASKTEHHENAGIRQVPIYPELKSYLQDVFEQAQDGQVNVITRYRDTNVNLRTQLNRIIKRAGLNPWPKLFQNLRATRQTELEDDFPSHVVCSWMGNSENIAKLHYLNVTEAHYKKAQQKAQQQGAELGRNESQGGNDEKQKPSNFGQKRSLATQCGCTGSQGMTPRGLEPLSVA